MSSSKGSEGRVRFSNPIGLEKNPNYRTSNPNRTYPNLPNLIEIKEKISEPRSGKNGRTRPELWPEPNPKVRVKTRT
jgi:hypothetical protein